MTADKINETTAAKVVANAAQVARTVVNQAAETAKAVVSAQAEYNASDERQTKILADALREVFGELEESKRLVDVSRIPLICQSIVDMHKSIDDINKNLTWGVRTVIGGVILALLKVVFVK